MNYPKRHDFPDHYRTNGLHSFTMTFINTETSDPVELDGATVLMELTNMSDKLMFEFSTLSNLTVSGNVVTFPEIKEWDIPAQKYKYTLKIIDNSGFHRTFMFGYWNINKDLTPQENG